MTEKVKTKRHVIRVFFTILIGIFITYQTYQFKYSSFLFDTENYISFIITGGIIWSVFVGKDFLQYKKKHQKRFLTNGILGLFFIFSCSVLYMKIQNTFEKPTLIKIIYYSDFNGTTIDFKKDGMYIYDEFCFGSNYRYGTYETQGNHFFLDQEKIGDMILSNHLEIIPQKDTVYQFDQNGKKINPQMIFIVSIDNRK